MEISMEIREASLALGDGLHATTPVQNYLKATASLQADEFASSLELNLDAMVASLSARKRAGNDLSPEMMDAYYYELRNRVWGNPFITRRNEMLELLKPLFADIADDINETLGVEFTALAAIRSE